jgi:membrane-bound metal-dependent hydrolase YbcI (DUF457 family)
MFVHVPIVIALAAVALFLFRKGAIKPTHGLACGALGFYLADTSFAGSIHAAGSNLLGMIGHFGL